MRRIIIPIALVFSSISTSHAMNLSGRLGIGLTNQVVTGIDALSFKLQRTRASAIGAIVGINTSSDYSNYAVGLKGYRLIYDEPQLNFYSALSAIAFTFQDNQDNTDPGYQIEGAFGTEFSFQGLESIGFSFEFGLGIVKQQGAATFGTVGHNVLSSAVHFYL